MQTILSNQWLRTDEAREAILAICMVKEMLNRVSDEPYYWKWVVLALHNTLQGYMVLALQGSNGLRVLKDDCAKAWLDAYERGDGSYPKPRLKNFMELYKSIQSDQMRIYEISQPFTAHGSQGRSVKLLNKLRNEFIHFTPKSWSLELSGLPKLTDDCIDVISFLAFESNNLLWHEGQMEVETRELIDQVRSMVNQLIENKSPKNRCTK
jgi:hypothetical protein